MLQSIGKGATAAKKQETRPATQTFVTEPLKPHTIAVGDVAHKNARRAHDSTLVGLAPPPPIHVSSLNTQPLALPKEQTAVVVSRDDRRLATILVLGTLFAMFSIALSALPESEPSAPIVKSAEPEPAAPPTVPSAAVNAPQVAPRELEAATVPAPVPAATAVAPSAPPAPQVVTPKAVKQPLAPARVPHVRAATKADGKVFTRRRSRATAN